MSDRGSTQSIDRLFCELAHVTRAKNYRELYLLEKLSEARQALSLFRSIAEGGEQVSDCADEAYKKAMGDNLEWPS